MLAPKTGGATFEMNFEFPSIVKTERHERACAVAGDVRKCQGSLVDRWKCMAGDSQGIQQLTTNWPTDLSRLQPSQLCCVRVGIKATATN